LLLALFIAAGSLSTYATSSLEELATESPSVAAPYADAPAFARTALYIHIVAASLALILGPLQFWRGLRDRFRLAHRITGRVYLVAVMLGALSAFVIAPYNSAGGIGALGFGLLAVVWLVTAWNAYRRARARDIPAHQAWMIRNFALTFAAVTLRLWLGVLIGIQLGVMGADADPVAVFNNAYVVVPFLCWIPNLIVAEWLIRRRKLPSLIGGSK
jgi:uncharacterized membrane protein